MAARHGDAELYSQFKAQMKIGQDSRRCTTATSGRWANFPEPNLIEQTLASTLTPEVRSQDLYILVDMMENPAARDTDVGFHAQELRRHQRPRLAADWAASASSCIGESFCSQEKAQEVEQFFQQHPIQGTERNQKEALESIHSCATLKQQQQTTLSAWLKQNASMNAANGGESPTTPPCDKRVRLMVLRPGFGRALRLRLLTALT